MVRGGFGTPPTTDSGLIERGRPAPQISATTLTGEPFDLASLRGRPVMVNFWGPSCIPCRDEFPLFKARLEALGGEGEGLAIVGVLMHDPPAPALDFIAELGATWPTVDDPGGAIRNAYRVAARPQTYFIDADGILRSIQIGELTDAEFDRHYALMTGAAPSGGGEGPSFSIRLPPPR